MELRSNHRAASRGPTSSAPQQIVAALVGLHQHTADGSPLLDERQSLIDQE
ncbi:MAG: hypothetical protein R2701_03355 [Acidimicrobiales bacterium]